jgi:hypothetical protein
MAKIALSAGPTQWVEDTTNLNAVIAATEGASVDMRWYNQKSIFILVSGNTGAVTVTIQGSHDGTNWMDLNSKIYTATNGYDVYHYSSYYPYMRTKTTTQSTSTVSTFMTGKS